jgi:ribonuclease HI
MDLVQVYRFLLTQVKPFFTHVKGHSGHPENEIVDRLAS